MGKQYCFEWDGIKWGKDYPGWNAFRQWLNNHSADYRTWARNHPMAAQCIGVPSSFEWGNKFWGGDYPGWAEFQQWLISHGTSPNDWIRNHPSAAKAIGAPDVGPAPSRPDDRAAPPRPSVSPPPFQPPSAPQPNAGAPPPQQQQSPSAPAGIPMVLPDGSPNWIFEWGGQKWGWGYPGWSAFRQWLIDHGASPNDWIRNHPEGAKLIGATMDVPVDIPPAPPTDRPEPPRPPVSPPPTPDIPALDDEEDYDGFIGDEQVLRFVADTVHSGERRNCDKSGDIIGLPYDESGPQSTHSIQFNAPKGTDNWQSENAVDICLAYGTPILAVGPGEIPMEYGYGDSGKGGRMAGSRFHLRTSDGNIFYYAHCSVILVPQGFKEVNKGEILAYSGWANGTTHLHFAVKPHERHGKTPDPRNWARLTHGAGANAPPEGSGHPSWNPDDYQVDPPQDLPNAGTRPPDGKDQSHPGKVKVPLEALVYALRNGGVVENPNIILVAIAGAESGWTIDAWNWNSDGSIDYGILQINSVHSPVIRRVFQLQGSASYAANIFGNQGLEAWTTYRNKKYLDYMPQARAAYERAVGAPPATQPPPVGKDPIVPTPAPVHPDWQSTSKAWNGLMAMVGRKIPERINKISDAIDMIAKTVK